MSQNEALQLLNKYLSDNCSEEEKRKVEEWLDTLDNSRGAWTALSEAEQTDYISKLLSDLQFQMHGERARKSTKRSLLLAAAVVLLLAGAFTLFYQYGDSISNEPVDRSKWITMETGIGEQKEVELGDGTHVWINASSSLKYPRDFGSAARVVALEGEAFFDVAKDSHSPFEVQSGDWCTRVLGTSFNVDSYKEDDAIKIAVLSGKVGISKMPEQGEQQHIVGAHEMASYQQQGESWQIDTIDAGIEKPSWVLGQLAFYHTPMHEVAKTLYRTYGVKVHFENPKIQQCELSGHFEIKQKMENVLQAICLSIGGDFSRQGMEVTIKGPGCL